MATFFKWKEGSQIKVDANVAGEVCSRLAAENRLTAKDLLNESREETAPLHNAFEWDDGVAAERYRESQAGHIIRCITVMREEAEPTRAFFKVTREAPQYETVETLMSVETTRNSLLEMALKELNWFKAKYNGLAELAALFSEIDRLTEQSA